MELHIDETVEPSASDRFDPAVSTASFSDVITRLKGGRARRALLGVARWAVPLDLIVSGYYGAAAISFGIDAATRDPSAPPPQLMVAASAPR
jgi:hypothetical protein